MTQKLSFLGLLLLCVWIISCTPDNRADNSNSHDLQEILQDDTLRVITMYGPTTYFMYRDNEMGYEYEIAKQLCRDMGVELKLILAPTQQTMIEWLQSGIGDVIAYRVPYTHQYKKKLSYTKREYISNQVLVQCYSDTMLKTVLDLVGHTIVVPHKSIFQQRLNDLNDEVGGGIEVETVDDSISSDQLIAQVAYHQIPFTISDDVSARLNKTYFGNLDYSLAISFPQRYAWVVSKKSPHLLEYINNWVAELNNRPAVSLIYRKYFEKSKYFESEGLARIPVPGRISPFDPIFKQAAKKIGWDWRLLAAIAYKESKFNSDVVSWAGACGLMQLMPNTALSLGLPQEEIFNPQKNVEAAVAYLRSLEKIFIGIDDAEERVKFVLAAYNAGPGHVFDARALASKYQKDPDKWEYVREYLLKKTEPEYYSDQVCRFGYCRGREPVTYVDVIMSKYADYKLWAR